MTNTRGYAAKNANDPLTGFDFKRRDVGPHDVQLEILFCGVCHSDLHQVRNDWAETWGPTVYPIVPGHEIVGRVTAVGDQVQKFGVGDNAAVGFLVDACRECDNCKKGLEQFCRNGSTSTCNSTDKHTGGVTYGGYSTLIVVKEDFVLKVSGKLPLPNVAPLLCAGITTYSSMRHWKVGEGNKVAVMGLGGLGHMAVKFAASFGAEVTMLSTSPEKEADARRLGAHHFVLTTGNDAITSLSGKFDFIIDTVAAEHDHNMYLQMLDTDGVMICLGAPAAPMPIMGHLLSSGRKSLVGASIGGLRETQEMLDYCADHNIFADVETIDMAYINEAYRRMQRGDVKYRFVIDMATL